MMGGGLTYYSICMVSLPFAISAILVVNKRVFAFYHERNSTDTSENKRTFFTRNKLTVPVAGSVKLHVQ